MKKKQPTVPIVALLILSFHTLFAAEITITHSGDSISVTWPAAGGGNFYLQSSTNLIPPVAWSNERDPATNGADLIVSDSPIDFSRFYRLQPWEILFDGTNTANFRSPQSSSFPSNSWFVTNSSLASKVVPGAAGLMTVGTYTNFELRLNWRCETNGNSGIFYRQPVAGGLASPEYQLFDDANVTNSHYLYQFANYTNAADLMGAVFGYIAPTNKVLVPTGQWNDCRVIVQDFHVTHWLNGNVIVDYEINDPAFTNVFTQATNTYILFQNKGNGDDGVVPGVVYFRDIKIRRLP